MGSGGTAICIDPRSFAEPLSPCLMGAPISTCARTARDLDSERGRTSMAEDVILSITQVESRAGRRLVDSGPYLDFFSGPVRCLVFHNSGGCKALREVKRVQVPRWSRGRGAWQWEMAMGCSSLVHNADLWAGIVRDRSLRHAYSASRLSADATEALPGVVLRITNRSPLPAQTCIRSGTLWRLVANQYLRTDHRDLSVTAWMHFVLSA
jgi:hypothetical protein